MRRLAILVGIGRHGEQWLVVQLRSTTISLPQNKKGGPSRVLVAGWLARCCGACFFFKFVCFVCFEAAIFLRLLLSYVAS